MDENGKCDGVRYFILVQDDSCHWYIIPAKEAINWDEWVDNEEDWDVPGYAVAVGGSPSRVMFSGFLI